MIFPLDERVGRITLGPRTTFVTGERIALTLSFTVGATGLKQRARLRIGLPNTGWERPVVPQLRYWDELVSGAARRYAPFHPVNTTAELETSGKAIVALESMERMLLPDEDPAEAYWRWWITATIEDAALSEGDQIKITYGDPRFVGEEARVQTFPEKDLTIAAYIDPGSGKWVRPDGAPIKIDVVSGPPCRANVVVPSVVVGNTTSVRIALTDACHCRPTEELKEPLVLRDAEENRLATATFAEGGTAEIELKHLPASARLSVGDSGGLREWGQSNPSIPLGNDGLQLFWGDLHAQSEYHVMHSQKKDARQVDWSKGISCGTPEDVYQYARDVALLDFVAITDQGAITGVGWDVLREKAAEYYRLGRFVTFNAYEAGSPVGHRNVFYRGEEADPRQDASEFNYMPEFLYKFYANRRDVIMIPHHVKTWTDWSFYDASLEPVMEVYSCWGQSENPSTERWDKGMTPNAGAWKALQLGYRLGMIASSDNHVGMPGRSYPHDRQVHTPFPGGLAAVWAPELSREAIFDAVRNRHCYGTTGARIILRFSVNDQPMGSELTIDDPRAPRTIAATIHGTAAIERAEIIRDGRIFHASIRQASRTDTNHELVWEDESPLERAAFYYVRVAQADGHMAWSSPIWVDVR
jgi:hypothetical protein